MVNSKYGYGMDIESQIQIWIFSSSHVASEPFVEQIIFFLLSPPRPRKMYRRKRIVRFFKNWTSDLEVIKVENLVFF